MKLANRFGFLVILAVAVVGALTLGPSLMHVPPDESDSVKVTFDVRLGDGNEWAGGADILYGIGGTGYPVRLRELPNGDRRQNTWTATRWVKRGTVVSLAATPQWQGVPVTIRLRGLKISPRPVAAVGRDTARIIFTVT